ncbi:MAG: hypothetical protein LBM71_02755 [Elusimicrobiota bacterium]|jgi:hypothetical protein|nr:hypothetical protein [Elusimicrobiota bacterium]
MKKVVLSIFAFVFCFSVAKAEAIKLKNGTIITGSIIGRTEYILNVKTEYGTININQREVDTIMPDLHRVLLKGGGEYIGTVLDLDEFNLSLKTDNGVVNIDVSQIVSMGIYDYNEAEKQKKYVETKVALEQAAATEAEAVAAASAGAVSTSGLSFDDDLEKVFPSKPKEIEPEIRYNYRVHDMNSAIEKAEQEAITPEPTLTLEEAETVDQIVKKDSGKNYFAVQAGLLSSELKLDLSKYGGATDEKLKSNNTTFGLAYMRRLTKRLWLGGSFMFGVIGKSSFEYPQTTDPNAAWYIESSGQVYDINLLFNFYLNPQSKLRFYLLGGGGFSSLSIENNPSEYKEITAATATAPATYGWVEKESQSVSNGSLSGTFGLGVEYAVQDINIGLEMRGSYSTYKNELASSGNLNIYSTLKVNWFF